VVKGHSAPLHQEKTVLPGAASTCRDLGSGCIVQGRTKAAYNIVIKNRQVLIRTIIKDVFPDNPEIGPALINTVNLINYMRLQVAVIFFKKESLN
jgi:hypothetical protein